MVVNTRETTSMTIRRVMVLSTGPVVANMKASGSRGCSMVRVSTLIPVGKQGKVNGWMAIALLGSTDPKSSKFLLTHLLLTSLTFIKHTKI